MRYGRIKNSLPINVLYFQLKLRTSMGRFPTTVCEKEFMVQILLRLQGRSHAPLLWGSGSTDNFNYIVMQLLSINLNEIRKQSPFQRLSRPTMGRIVIQAIAALRDIHQLGYIHRDIKPQNMCFGLSQASKHRLIIVDYGLARRFRHSSGRLRPLREQCGFRGTTIYASLRSHDGKDLGPSDDLISLFYSAIEMVKGELPWKGLRRAEDVKLCKMAMVNSQELITKITEN
uniref:non-specific serine/threonine protein kinase n=1 Tax=Parascaris univalens TaxID=6257 RepID=A0A915B4F6_PARUN